MVTAKQHAEAALKVLPDDCSMEDLLYHLYVSYKIERGLRDVQEGRVLSQSAAEREYRRWRAGKPRGFRLT